MLTETLAALGAAGGTAVVGAMATDAWKATRNHAARLFSRRGAGQQEAIEAALDEHAGVLAETEEAQRAQVRQELVPVWQQRMVDLLEQHPDAATDLRDLITRIDATVPPAQQAWVQRNTATAGGIVIAHQGTGTQVIHSDQSPGPATAEITGPARPGDGR